MKYIFAKGQWLEDDLIRAYTFRFIQTPKPHQAEECIYSDINHEHPEGYDNISFLTKEKYTAGAAAQLHCSFEGVGCPEIIIVPEAEQCEDQAVRYGACFEIVLWKNGINVWRHYREAGKCSWHLRLGLSREVAENEMHTLQVKVCEEELHIDLNGNTTILHVDDLPKNFHMGFTMCEGVARVYDFSVEDCKAGLCQ